MNGAILRSTDRGNTWQRTMLPFKSGGNMPGRNMGERLAIDPNRNSTLYLGARSGNGLWRSTDFGATWAASRASRPSGTYVAGPDDPNGYLSDRHRRHLGRLRPAHGHARQHHADDLRRRRRPRHQHLPQHQRRRDLGRAARPAHRLHAAPRRAGLERHALRHLQQQGRARTTARRATSGSTTPRPGPGRSSAPCRPAAPTTTSATAGWPWTRRTPTRSWSRPSTPGGRTR